MTLIQSVHRAKDLFKVIGALNPACQHLTYVSLEISATGLIWQEEPRFVCKRMAGGYSVVFLIPVAINYNRICNVVVVQVDALAIVFFSWHFPIISSWNAYIRNNILFYGIGQKLGKKSIRAGADPVLKELLPIALSSPEVVALFIPRQFSSFPACNVWDEVLFNVIKYV